MRKTWDPKPYQPQMMGHMLEHPGCALWVPMGMGKTVAVLSVLDVLRLLGETRPALVIAPLRVARSTWPEEAAK